MSHELLAGQLRQQLGVLMERLRRIEQDASRSHSSDWAEQAQERENDEVVDSIGNETRLSIRRIQAALQRIEAGEYGICERCGDEINPARLAVLPETTHCVNCAG